MGFARVMKNETCFPFIVNGEQKNVTQHIFSWRFGVIISLIALILTIIVIAVSTNLGTESADSEAGTRFPDPPASTNKSNAIPTDSLRLIERRDWAAQPASKTLNNLTEIPAPYVIISHTATEWCESQGSCTYFVRVIQTLHMESFGYSDIGYNFLVGGDGLAYVARGWDIEGAHTRRWNKKSIGISFIGTFNDIEPCEKQLIATSKLIELGIKLGKISTTYKLLGHRQVSDTLSPGDKLYHILTKWEHWSPDISF